jgi:hypothetical protein
LCRFFNFPPANLYNRFYNRYHQHNGRDADDAPAVATVTPGCRSSHHVRAPFYRAGPLRQAGQALSRLPPHRPPRRRLVQEDSRQAVLLRPVG